MRIIDYFCSQFGKPRGYIGRLCCVAMNMFNQKLYRGVLNAIAVEDDANVLEIGYGNGYLIQQMCKRYRVIIHGVDISEDMKETATRRNQGAVSAGRVYLTIGDCCNLPYGDASFDCAVSVNSLYFWKDTLQGLKEVNRVLKQGACFCTSIYTKAWFERSKVDMKGGMNTSIWGCKPDSQKSGSLILKKVIALLSSFKSPKTANHSEYHNSKAPVFQMDRN